MHGLGVNPISGQIAGRRVGRKIRKGLKRKRKEEKDEEEGRSGRQGLLLPRTQVWFPTLMLSGSQLPLTSVPGDLDTLF